VTVITEHTFQSHFKRPLQKSKKPLKGPNSSALEIVGEFPCCLQKGDFTTTETIYVVKQLRRSLLGRPAFENLCLLSRLDCVIHEASEFTTKYQKVYNGLDTLSTEYHIRLTDNARLFAMSTPCKVPLPLILKVKTELSRMEDINVISTIDEPTDWCAPMVVVPKPNGHASSHTC
jgi:hypothetical protein